MLQFRPARVNVSGIRLHAMEKLVGSPTASLESLVFVRSEADASAVVSQCAQAGKTIRVAGAGHSHAPLVTNDSVIVDSSGLAGLLEVDRQAQEAWVRAGSSIYSLGGQLHDHGLALKNQGDIDRQLLGGAIATGTHGTGRNLQNISASVTGLHIILANGEQVECSKSELPELFSIARLSVGSAGLITRIKMKLQESVVLSEQIHVSRLSGTPSIKLQRWWPKTTGLNSFGIRELTRRISK